MTLTETRRPADAEELVPSPMRVRKRDGSLEPVDVNKIVRAVSRCCAGLEGVDPMRVATRTISGLCDGASTEELDTLSIRTATALVAEEPNYSRLAARLLSTVIDKEVANQDIHSFSQSVAAAHRLGVIGDDTAGFVARYAGSSTTPSSPSATRASSSSACARSTTATCCATPRRVRCSKRRSTSSCELRVAWPRPPRTPSSSTG